MKRRLLSIVLLCLCLTTPTIAQSSSLLADQVEIVKDKTIVASGNVEVIYGEYRLRAPQLIYDSETETLTIEGPIVLEQGENTVVFADSA